MINMSSTRVRGPSTDHGNFNPLPHPHTLQNEESFHPTAASSWTFPSPVAENMTDTDSIPENLAGVGNGVRSSPSPNIPNGKPASPYVKESTPVQTVSSKDPKAAAAAANDMRNVVRRKLTGYVGFANLPNQWHRKSVRKGFNFNVMVVGMLHKTPF